MAVNYSTAVKNARLDEVTAAIDAGSGPGVIEIGDSGFATVLATLTLQDPSAGAAAAGVLTFDTPIEDTSADDSGTAAEARIKDSDGNVVVSGLTVSTSGADINLDSTSISAGQNVSLSSASITHG